MASQTFRRCPRCRSETEGHEVGFPVYKCPTCGELCCDKCIDRSGGWNLSGGVNCPECSAQVHGFNDLIGNVRA